MIIMIFESTAFYNIKMYSISNDMRHIIASSALYAMIPILLYKIVKLGNGIAITNITWNIASTLYGLFIGVILFNEHITTEQKIGAILGMLGTIIILWHSDN
jgi:drug/metabolite transporter (DMT)-like permease